MTFKESDIGSRFPNHIDDLMNRHVVQLNIDGSDEEKDESAIQQSARAGAAVLSDANRSLANILQGEEADFMGLI